MLEILKSYQCEKFEILGQNGPEVRTFSGGGFTHAIARQGLKPLLSLLEQVQEIRAFDQGNQVYLKREGEQVQVQYRWLDGSQYQQLIPLQSPSRRLPQKSQETSYLEKEPEAQDEPEYFIEDTLPEPKNLAIFGDLPRRGMVEQEREEDRNNQSNTPQNAKNAALAEVKIASLEERSILLEKQRQRESTLQSLKEEERERESIEKERQISVLQQKLVQLENQLRETTIKLSQREAQIQEDVAKDAQIASLQDRLALFESQLQEVNILREEAILKNTLHKNEFSNQESSEEGYAKLGQKFCRKYGVIAPYIAGAMAGGISSVQLVQAMSRGGMLAFFGSGGLPLEQLQYAMQQLAQEQNIWGCNLLHNPNEPMIEEKSVDILLHFGVRFISASAYIQLTKALIRYRYAGIEMVNGQIYCPNQVFAKISHPLIAERFLSPPPQNLLLELLREGVFRQEQIMWAKQIPVASALIIEGDSGGHTDSRPLSVIFPAIRRLRDQIVNNYQFSEEILLGAAGGLGDPSSLKAAYAMGADFVVVGSVHQSTVEAGTSPKVKELLATATIVDCAMGAAPDMFEQGAHVQVFSKNNFYALRSKKLFNLYKQYPSIFEIPKGELERLERQIFQAPLQQIWNEVELYWQERDIRQLERASREPKHQMALMFRWYLGQSSRWAREGNLARVKDYQIWCGPAIGAFNAWARGTKLEQPEARNIVEVVFALLDEVLTRK